MTPNDLPDRIKRHIPLLLACPLVSSGHLFGQTFFTNSISHREAMKLVSRLEVGMREEDVTRFFEANGLHLAARAGAIGGWDSVYVLTNGCSLRLDYTPREFIGVLD